MTQQNGNNYCKSTYGTTLASIHSSAENIIVSDLCSSVGATVCWIGRYCQEYQNGETIPHQMNDSCWTWYDETEQDFGQYQQGASIYNGTIIYSSIHASAGNWDDWPSDTQIYFICNSQYITNNEYLSFTEQETLCNFRYENNLASIHNNTENAQIFALCNTKTSPCFFGLKYVITEGMFQWTDNSSFDFGNNVSGNDGSGPWISGEPNNYQDHNENCVTARGFETAPVGWNDHECDAGLPALCNVPSVTYSFNDPIHYERVPIKSHIIGEMYTLDDIYIELYVVVNSFQSGYRNILHIGNTHSQYIPGIWVYEDGRFHFSQSYATKADNWARSIYIQTNTVYHIQYHMRQDNVIITLNDTIVSDVDAESHSMITANIYFSSAWTEPADAVVKGLKIRASNNNKPGDVYNYLCDYPNRFSTLTGTWTSTACTASASYAVYGAQSWLATKDSSTLQWRDYKIEVVINFQSGTGTAGITFRTNGAGSSYLQGSTYNLYIYKTDNTVKLATVVNGYNGISAWTILISEPLTITDGGTYTLRAEISDNYIRCYVNNKFIAHVIDNSYSSGSIGLQAWQSTVSFTSLRIMFANYNSLYTVPPTLSPTNIPTTTNPTTTPTLLPTLQPTYYTSNPSKYPTNNPTQIPTLIPTNNPIRITLQPTSTPVDDGSSGEQYDLHTTEDISFNKNDNGDGFLNNNGITSTYFIYIIVGAALLCCCFIGLFFKMKCRKLKQRKNDQIYLGPTDLVQITSISGKDDIITPIGKDNGNYSLDTNVPKNSEAQIMEDITDIVNGTPMGAFQSDEENVDTQQLKEGNNDEEILTDVNTLATPNGIDSNAKQNNRTEVDTDSDILNDVDDIDINNQNNVTTQGYKDNIAEDEFIINDDQDIETDEGTTEEDELDDPLDADNIADTLDTKT
eukprot:232773_1